MIEQVHWHEGLFLQPHHLQAMQWSMHHRIAAERKLAWTHPWGVIEASLAMEALADARVEFTRLRAIMPSGIEVNFPYAANLPTISIKDRFTRAAGPLSVKLAVPLRHESRANTIETANGDFRAKRLFTVNRIECPDENTGENPQEIAVRQINARLILDGDDETDMDVMPLLRLVPNEQNKPALEPNHVPPCFIVRAWPSLRLLVEELASHINSSRDQMVRQMRREGFTLQTMRPYQIEHMFRLRTFNTFSRRLRELAEAPAVSPFAVYLELWELLAELSAVNPGLNEKDDHFDRARGIKYDHNNPGPAFHELSRRIRELSTVEKEITFVAVPFKKEPARFICDITEDQVARANAYFLQVRTKHDQRALQELIEDKVRFKLMPAGMSGREVFGIPLEREMTPPPQFPAEPGVNYFRLLREADSVARSRWEQVEREKRLVAEGGRRGGGIMEIGDAQLTLYMTIPTGAS